MKKNNLIILLAAVAIIAIGVFLLASSKSGKGLALPTPNVGLLNKNDKSNDQLNKDFVETQNSLDNANKELNNANQDNSSLDQVPSGY